MDNEVDDFFDSLFEDTSRVLENKIRLGFGYPGNKLALRDEIIPRLPRTGRYIEVCGGSGSILMNQEPQAFEVYNDRCSGVTAFFRCVRDRPSDLMRRIKWCVYSKEEWIWSKETWANCHDDVERAVRWFYMIHCSFGSRGDAWGRVTSDNGSKNGVFGKIANNIKALHRRWSNVQIENDDLLQMFARYDDPLSVFLVDPTYLNSETNIYTHSMTFSQHETMLKQIMLVKGYVLVTHYDHYLYRRHDWDEIVEVNHKKKLSNAVGHTQTTEILWIKKAQS